MPGAGSLILANHLFKIAPTDGTYVGMFAMQVAVEPFLKNKAAVFDPLKFQYVGTLARNHQYCAVVPGPGVATSMEELLRKDAKETLSGSAGSGRSGDHRQHHPLKNVWMRGCWVPADSGHGLRHSSWRWSAAQRMWCAVSTAAAFCRRQHGPDRAVQSSSWRRR